MRLETFEQDLHIKINSALNELDAYVADCGDYNEEAALNTEDTVETELRVSSNVVAIDDPELIHAAGTGDLQRVFALLYCEGIEPNITSASGVSALVQATLDRHENLGVIELLIDRGADVNAATADGLTALMVAVIKGYKSVVLRLLAAGADVHKKDIFGYDATNLAKRLGHDEIVELLLESSMQ